MAPRVYWIGSFGPFHFNDADLFIDGSPHRMAVDRAPIANDDVVRLQDIGGIVGGIIQIVPTANILDPTELNALDGFANGALAMVAETAGAALDEMTLYAWDSNPGAGAEDPPYLVDGAGGSMWIAVGGSFHYEGIVFGDSVNNLTLGADGVLSLNGTARVTNSIKLYATISRPAATAPTEAIIGDYDVLQYADAGPVESAKFLCHIPEDWAQGTDIMAHIHWAPTTNAGGNVKWDMNYTPLASNANEVLTAAGTALTVTDATQTLQDELLESPNMTISAADIASEDCIGLTLSRDNTVGGNYGDPASFVLIEIEYTSDRLGL